MKYKKIHFLINLLEEYEKESSTIENNFERNFGLWLLSKRPIPGRRSNEIKNPNIDGNIGMLLSFLGKYLGYYSKKLFRYSKIYSITDFGYMMTLFPQKSLTKTELIKANLMEKSSGMDVIKRLLKDSLIIEIQKEKKQKHLTLSKLGIEELDRIMFNINKLSKHLTATLSEDEKEDLLSTLTKLHQYHKPYFDNKNDKELNKILHINILKG